MDSQNDGVMVKWSHGATRLRAVRTIKRWHNYAFVHGSMCIYVGPITGRSASVDACHILLANISSIFRFFPVGTAHFFTFAQTNMQMTSSWVSFCGSWVFLHNININLMHSNPRVCVVFNNIIFL